MTNLKEKNTKNEEKDDIVIHTMPSRFFSSHNAAKKAKNTGIIILIVGMLFLIGGAVFLYFYFFDNNSTSNANMEVGETSFSPSMEISKQADNKKDELISEKPKTINSDYKKEQNDNLSHKSNYTEDNIKKSTNTPSVKILQATSSNLKTATASESNIGVKDKDSDGLSDVEEILLGTSPALIDSDGDGYSDKQELEHLYNPTGSGKLKYSHYIKMYNNDSYNYFFLYPAEIEIKDLGKSDSLMILLTKNEFIQIIIQENKTAEPIFSWYKEQFNNVSVDPKQIISFNNWQGIKNKEGNIVYLTDPNNEYIVTISYNSGLKESKKYANIFNLILRSFSFDNNL